MSMVFGTLLQDFTESGILERVEPGHNGKIPARCHDPSKFHCPQVSDKALKSTAAATSRGTFFEEAVCSSEEDHESPMNTLK